MKDKTGWLVEMEGPQWASLRGSKFGWTIDSNQALRFARKEDSDNFRMFLCLTQAVSTEHRWVYSGWNE